MKQTLLQEKYPVYILEVSKDETPFNDLNEVTTHFKGLIDAHKVARHIADFDHHAHTAALEDGHIEEGMVGAQNIVFCFGTHLPKAEMLAVRPRSIGVAEYDDRFVISFLEAPMPMANEAMEKWAKSVAH